MSLSTGDIHAIGEAAKTGRTVAAAILLNLAKALHDKTYSSITRQTCFKFLAALARNGQHLSDDVFEALLIVLRDGTEAEELRRVASFVMMGSLADGYKHDALKLVHRDSFHLVLCDVLQKDPSLFIRSCAACALPYVLDKGAPFPEFLNFYLEEAGDDHLIQPYVQGAREQLYSLTSDTTSDDIFEEAVTVTGGAGAGASAAAAALTLDDPTLPQRKKSLDELIAELEHNNPESLINTSFATELHSGLLRTQFEAVRDISEKQSTLLVTQPTLDKWDLDTCAMWSKSVQSDPAKTLDPAFMPEMIAVLSRARSLVKNQQLRDIQILSLLILLNAKDKGRITEIATGEGKTALVAMLAAFKALQGRKVDVISSSGVLAHRDATEEKTFYKAMGITVADTEDPKKTASYLSGLKECYLADVVYGDITFEWDALRTEYQLSGTRGERPYDVAIVDEVDSMLIEDGAKLALLGGCQPDMEQLQPLLIALWTRLQYENTPDHFIEEDGCLYWQANKESEKIEVRDKLSCLKQILEAHAQALISEKDSPILVPAHLKSFALAQAKYWAKSAVMASEKVHLDRDYVLSFDEEGKGTIAPIDFMNTGVTQLKSAWTNGLHQFLQMKHGLVLTPETLTTSFISNRHYFSRYGSNLYGVTGTLGGIDAQSLLTEVYPLDLVFVPPFKVKQLTMLPGILAGNHEMWLKNIIDYVKSETEAGRAVLVICETNLLVAAVEKALMTAGILKLRRYARSDLEEQSAPTKPMDEGEVLIATSLGGRGTDLKISETVKRNKGLHVCLTYLPNKRGRNQAFGRTARQGQEGSAQLIVNKKAIEAQFEPHYFLLGQADTLENAILWRDKIEEARLEDIKQFELKKVALQERLFERFSLLRKRLRTVENNQYRLADLEERWAFWLKTIDNQILTTDNPDETIILAAYEQFEREVSSAYMERKLQNPGYWISEGNRLFAHDQAQALAAYNEASTLDPIFAFPSYYAQARQLILGHHNYEKSSFLCLPAAQSLDDNYRYKFEALDNLKKAKTQIETYLMPQIQATRLMYSSSLRYDASPKNELLKQYKDKEFLLHKILENIEESIWVIEHAPDHVRFSNNTSLFNLFYGEEPPEAEIAALCRMGLTHLVSYEEVPEEKEDSLFDAFLCTVWGMAQIVVGVCLTLSGNIAWGAFFISEGLGDIIHTAHTVMATGGFSWKDYGLHKEISLAISAVCWGVESIKSAVAAKAGAKTVAKEMGCEALMKEAKRQVTQALVSAGIHEAANAILDAASRATLAQFKEEIEAHVRSQLKEAMSDPALQEAINTLLSIDFQNKNQRCEQQIHQIASNLLNSQQARLKTIVSAVVNGVLRQHSKVLSVLKTVHDIAQVTSQLTDFCDRFCEEFSSRVRFLAQKNSAGITIEIEESFCKPHCDTLILSITNDVRQYISRTLHHGVVRPIYGTVMDKKITQFETKVLDAIHKVKKPTLPQLEGVAAGDEDDTEIEHKDDAREEEGKFIFKAHPDVVLNPTAMSVSQILELQKKHTFLADLAEPAPSIGSVPRIHSKPDYTHAVYSGVTSTLGDCWNLVKDISRLSADASLITVAHGPGVPEFMAKLLQHTKLYKEAEQRMQGRGRALGETFDSVSQFIYDAAVIYAAHPSDIELSLSSGSSDILYSKPYLTAISRMQDRGEVLAKVGRSFMAASGPERVEITTRLITGAFAPGLFLKGALGLRNLSRNLRNFGTIKEPPRFMNQDLSDLPLKPAQFERMNASQVKAAGRDYYKWVLTEDMEFFVAARDLKIPVIRRGEVSPFMHHHELANLKPVYLAGEFMTNNNGLISGVYPFSGHYMPAGTHLQKLTERTFLRNGFPSITGKYEPLEEIFRGTPVILEIPASGLGAKMMIYVAPASGVAVSRSSDQDNSTAVTVTGDNLRIWKLPKESKELPEPIESPLPTPRDESLPRTLMLEDMHAVRSSAMMPSSRAALANHGLFKAIFNHSVAPEKSEVRTKLHLA